MVFNSGGNRDYSSLRENLAADLQRLGLESHSERVLELARPAVRFKPEPANHDSIQIGLTKAGGWPDAPAGFEWPYSDRASVEAGRLVPEGNPYPIPFLLQIDLRDVAQFDTDLPMPPSGLLSVFHGADVYEAHGDRYEYIPCEWRAFHFPEGAPLERHTSALEHERFLSQLLTPEQALTLPEFGVLTRGVKDYSPFFELDLPSRAENEVQFGGHTMSTGNGDPLNFQSLRPRDLLEAEKEVPQAEYWYSNGWRHLLSMSSRDASEDYSERNSSNNDYVSASFGGDGVMSMFIKPDRHGNTVGPDSLANVLAQVLR